MVPRKDWIDGIRHVGFSAAAADAYARMTAVTVDHDVATAQNPIRSDTTLKRYIDALVTEGP